MIETNVSVDPNIQDSDRDLDEEDEQESEPDTNRDPVQAEVTPDELE